MPFLGNRFGDELFQPLGLLRLGVWGIAEAAQERYGLFLRGTFPRLLTGPVRETRMLVNVGNPVKPESREYQVLTLGDY